MEGEATLRRLIEQVEQMRQQHVVDLEIIRARHETDLAVLRAENEHICAQLPRHPSDQPPQPSNQNDEEGHSVSQPPIAPKAPTHRSTVHRSHVPTNRSDHEVSNVPAQSLGHRASIRRHPFVDGIMETPLPFGWKPLNIDRYDGTADPDEHIDLYVTQVFPTLLKGVALAWYTQLPAGSIDNFDTLVRRFTEQYATSQPHHVTSTALASLRQGDDEPLREFMERFASISIKIRNLNPEVTLHAMLMALSPRPFVDSLCRRSPLDMDELCARAARYIQMEEHFTFRDQARGKSQAKLDHDHKDKMKVTNDSQFKKAARANKGGRNYGHTTEECHTLKDRIEELIQGAPRTIRPTVAKSQRRLPRPKTRTRLRFRDSHGPTLRFSAKHWQRSADRGGFTRGGSSSSARKRYLRKINNVHSTTSAPHHNTPPITFTDDDYTSICLNQDDPMVITVEVTN
ncbi:uncharacterized protein LOC109787897 [Cajanus cajan]|uniref:uncharacterized protein LOC109787897 n=1 Tax=Cajanus cajan TaxID=3821 RepID=UPI00098DA773|nr:uncharacterized protein LOC109787897 [Cajanus cajan]